ncbi:MAG: efflux RND transporter permease subunit [Candidatus Acidiferrales bacterium]
MNLVRFFRENRYAVFLLTLFLFGAGLFSVFQLPSNIYPETNFPRVVILVHSDDLAPDAMLLSTVRPIEQAASTVQGMLRVRSETIRGASEISVLFNPATDMQNALQLVQGQVSQVEGSLPPGTEVQVARISPTVFPVLSLILSGNVPAADLNDYGTYVLKPLFSRVPGVGGIEVQASDTREVSVIVDPQKMLAHHLSLVDIADRLKATNEIASVGRLQKDYQQYLILANSQFTNLDQIRGTIVAVEGQVPVRLGDIAEVRDGVADRTLLISGNGEPAALINISRQIGGNILQVAGQVKSIAANLGSAIPRTLHLSIVYDLAEFVQDSINSVRDAILIGAMLAVLVLYFFLRDVRTTLIAATSLPLSVVGTFFFIYIFGGTLNLMSLGGLAIAIGIIIDDAVVVIENIYRHRGRGESIEEAAEKGTAELVGPVVSSTATTLVVFRPLALLSGFVGDFFRALCMSLGVSILLSLFFALALIPMLSEQFLAKRGNLKPAKFIEPVNRGYEKGVRWALRHRGIVAGATVVLLAVGVFLYWKVETGFLPEMDEGGFVLDYLTPPGTSLAETDRIVHQMELLIAKTPETESFSRRTGAEMGLFATEQNKGDILVRMKPLSERRRSTEEVMDDLRGQIAKSVPGAQVEFSQILQDMLGDLEGSPEPIEIKIFGDDLNVLEQAANQVGPLIQKVPGVVDFKSVEKGNPEIVFHVDPGLAGRVGMTVDSVSEQVSAGLLGLTETSLRQADRTIDIRVRFPDSFRNDLNSIQQFPVVTPDHQIVRLSSLGTVEQVRGENKIIRENQRLMVDLTARLSEDRDLGGAMQDVQNVLNGVHFPTGCTYEIGGQYASQQQSFHELLSILGLALAAVFTVLVIQFREFRPALIILSAAPLSLVGAFAMLEITGTPLNVSSFMGIILMIGLVVKNGIILFEYVEKLWKEQKMPLDEALVAAGRIRLRPILMTTLATLFGLLPLALGWGSGAELQKPLALAVIGGLLLSTFITLLVMPVMFSLLEREAN